MRHGLMLAVVALCGLTTAARADFIYQGRFITLRIGTNKSAPVAPAPLPESKMVLPPSGLPLEVAPPGSPVPPVGKDALPPPTVIVSPKPTVSAFSVSQFANGFKPACGNHRVTLIHPLTNCPVEVCFTLPDGCPKVNVSRRMLEFDYGKQEVEIHFERNGKVRVEYQR